MNPLITYPLFKALDDNGNPLRGGKLYTYEVGTTTPKTTYSDYDFQTSNANPTILNARGEATIYTKGETKLVLKDSSDVTIWTADNVGSSFLTTLANEGTPSVLGLKNFVTGGTTTITNFDDGQYGQEITIIAEHTISITDGSSILLHGNHSLQLVATDTLTLIFNDDDKWHQKSVSYNGAVITDTTTNLEDVSNAINTTNKGLGKRVWNTTTSLWVFASGTAAADAWVNEAGQTAHSPV